MISNEQEARMTDNEFRPLNGNRDNEKAADQALRLECLKLAVALVGRGNPIAEAERLAAYVRTGVADAPARKSDANSLLDAVVAAETAFRRDQNRPQPSPVPEAE